MSETPYYGLFSGPINGDTLHRMFGNFAAAIEQGCSEAHLLFQSGGGSIGDGISLYNFFRGLPIPLHIYNTGSVCSAAATAFLGAAHRYVSDKATFLIHKSFFVLPQTPHRGPALDALVHTLVIDDARSEAILRERTNLSDATWAAHAVSDVTLDAAESVEFGLAQAVREWQVPAGQRVFNI